jgi:hypothetical protein
MNITSVAVDNFHPAPDAITRLAKTLSYEEREHEGHKYKGIGVGYSPEGVAELISSILGRAVIDMEYFRLGTSVGNEITNYIHADAGISQWAAVWYLSTPPIGVVAGTAFWRHKETGLEAVPDKAWLTNNKMTPEDLAAILQRDNMDESKWEMTGLIGQKYNRIALYPTKIFHSRYPQEAWGKDISDGRLCWTAFLRTA